MYLLRPCQSLSAERGYQGKVPNSVPLNAANGVTVQWSSSIDVNRTKEEPWASQPCMCVYVCVRVRMCRGHRWHSETLTRVSLQTEVRLIPDIWSLLLLLRPYTHKPGWVCLCLSVDVCEYVLHVLRLKKVVYLGCDSRVWSLSDDVGNNNWVLVMCEVFQFLTILKTGN